VGNR
jgi:hypothetical protein